MRSGRLHRMSFRVLSLLLASAVIPAVASPVTYTLDPSHSFVHFAYSHMGFSHQEQRINKVSGSITFDAAAKTGSVDVAIDLRSVDTGSKLDEDIQGPEFFDTAKFPVATFKSTAVRFVGDKPVAINGDLTIKGITKPAVLKLENFHQGIHPFRKSPAIGADATAKISRAAYGMGADEPLVGDEVTVRIDLEAFAPKPQASGQ